MGAMFAVRSKRMPSPGGRLQSPDWLNALVNEGPASFAASFRSLRG